MIIDAMKRLLLLISLFSVATAEDFPLSEERISEIESALLQWRQIATEKTLMPDSEYLDKLGLGLRKTSLHGPYTVGDRAGTHDAIKSKIVSIPGHAEYFGNKITIPYAAIKQAYADGKKTGMIGWSHFLTDSTNTFKTLSMIPSHETVRVLGDMLSDDWRWPGYEKRQASWHPGHPCPEQAEQTATSQPSYETTAHGCGYA